jgi:2-dehydro-3-deoxy-D-arabinonate dehydratase
MKLYCTVAGLVVSVDRELRLLPRSVDLDGVFVAAEPEKRLRSALGRSRSLLAVPRFRAPVQSQEVWAAGVTYQRSRQARIMEARKGGGAGDFYDRVYAAARPELFFKATAHRVAAPGEPVRIRRDSRWNVPEPELTLAINAHGRIFGYTIGNDMSSRDIEAENPLYLPQAKVYDRCAALGPCLLVTDQPLAPSTEIILDIRRGVRSAFSGRTPIRRIKRPLAELAEFLFRDNAFPRGCYLMTGTGIVPPEAFSLQAGDEVRITIPPIGLLANPVICAN